MAYIGNGPGVSSQRIVSEFEPTTDTTSFTPSSGYTVGYVDVYLNGIKLQNGTDFTASNGTNVVLTDAAVSGDLVEIVAYIPRGLSDGYTKGEADARYMDINAVTLPDQSGHSGQFLQSDGTNADWATVDLTQFDAPVQFKNYTTLARNALTGLSPGDTIYNSTTGSIEFYDGSNWIATNLIPSISSITGNIYAGVSSTITLSITNATDTVDVKYYEGSTLLATDSAVTVTSGSATSTVPSAVYGQSGGDTISIQIFNQDGTPSSNNVSKTVIGLPTGGATSSSGNYIYHTFTTSSTFSIPSGFSASMDYLLVAGGGAGSQGGGGAGGMISGTVTPTAGSYTIVVGGGAAATGDTRANYGANGSNTTGLSYTAVGGGGGGAYGDQGVANRDGRSGGSGGGGGGLYTNETNTPGGSGTSGQGNAGGGSQNLVNGMAGGGGGKGSAGIDGDAGTGFGNGGSGSTWVNNVTYAGGGGGGASVSATGPTGAGGLGGSGGGADGGKYQGANATTATVNTGGGGGGGLGVSAGYSSGFCSAGASGVFIIRYDLTAI
jgi:hypothetical protein